MPALNFRSSKSALDRRHLVSPVLQARRRLGIAIALGVVLCALTYFFYTSPKTSAENAANSALTTNRQLLATAEANLKSTRSGTASACVEYRQDRVLDQLLPATQPDVSLGTLSSVLQSSGLTVTSISPPTGAPLGTSSGALYSPYIIAIAGAYPELHAAIEALGRYSPLITVGAVNLTASTTASGRVTATITADQWWYPAVAALPAVNSPACK
jgi:Tfp pilus assembly protein PilO